MMSAWSDLFSLKGLVSLAVTIPLAVGALLKLGIGSARVNIRRDSPIVRGIGHTVVTGGARGSTIIGGQGHAVSITQQRFEAALRPGEGIALGFWGWVCLSGIWLIVLFVPYGADFAVAAEFVASVALPVVALLAAVEFWKSGERIGGAVAYFIFTVLISWIVLRNYGDVRVGRIFGGLGFLPMYAPSFRPSFDALFLGREPGGGNDFANGLIIASAAFGFAMLVVTHTKIGFGYLAGDRGVTHAVQVGLLSLAGAFSAVLFVSGLGQAVWEWWIVPQFIWAIVAQTFPGI
jgi:hypothetical protein